MKLLSMIYNVLNPVRPKDVTDEVRELMKDMPIADEREGLDAKIAKTKTYSINDAELKDIFEDLNEKEYKELIAQCSQVYNNPCFKFILNRLANQQINYIARNADTIQNIDLARGCLSGFYLVDEKFEFLDSEYKDLVKPEEEISQEII